MKLKTIIILLVFCLIFIDKQLFSMHLLKSLKEKFLANTQNYERLDSKHEEFICRVADKLNIKRQCLKIYKISNELEKKFKKNIFATGISSECFIFVDEELFENLSPAAKRFVIGHELMHIKSEHSLKRIGMAVVSGISCAVTGIYLYKYLNKYLKNYLSKLGAKDLSQIINNKLISNKINYALKIGEGVIIGLPVLSIFTLMQFLCWRDQELEADRESALKLNCINGGIEFCEIYNKYYNKYNYSSFIRRLFSGHPSWGKRIKELKKLKRLKQA